jgi:hypothetical protein
VSLLPRFGLRLFATNPWLIDLLLATAFVVIVLAAHYSASEACVVAPTVGDYHTGAGLFVLLVGLDTVAPWCSARERAIGAGGVLMGLTFSGQRTGTVRS